MENTSAKFNSIRASFEKRCPLHGFDDKNLNLTVGQIMNKVKNNDWNCLVCDRESKINEILNDNYELYRDLIKK